ncbi:MAG: hypothetical protein SPF59_06210 [Oscillospiraceae bacterium]|nr:hypothetical protein [Oscillospiraceae bacterium]
MKYTMERRNIPARRAAAGRLLWTLPFDIGNTGTQLKKLRGWPLICRKKGVFFYAKQRGKTTDFPLLFTKYKKDYFLTKEFRILCW